MQKLLLPVVSLAGVLALGGCGTTVNIFAGGPCVPYGGAMIDAEATCGGLASVAGFGEEPGEIDRPTWLLLACGGIVDFPFSILADTATLPITLRSTLEKIRTPKGVTGTTPEGERVNSDRSSEESPASQQESLPRTSPQYPTPSGP